MDSNNFYADQEPKKKRGLGSAIIVIILVIVLAFGAGAGGAYLVLHYSGNSVVTTTTTNSASSSVTKKDASGVAAKMTASVVAITTEAMTTDNFWFGRQVTSGAGSGVIMSSNGYIITCAHVVNGASTIKVTTSDNKTYSARLVGSYTKGDVAVVKINATGLKAATFADSSKVKQGATTYAVGNPEGTFSDSITSGIVSALNRTITVSLDDDNSRSSSNNYSSFFNQTSSTTAKLTVIQTDAAVSPGNSGGGLFDGSGNLIGIVNAKSSDSNSEGLGFAIPSNTALKIARSLVSSGSYNE